MSSSTSSLLRATCCAIVAGIVGWSLATSAVAQPAATPPGLQALLERLQPKPAAAAVPKPGSLEPARVAITAEGYLRYLGAPPGHHFPVATVVAGDPAATAHNFLQENAAVLGMTRPPTAFRTVRTTVKPQRSYVRLQQTYDDLPVFGAQAIVQLDKAGGVESLASDIAHHLQPFDAGLISTTPQLSAVDTEARVQELFADEHLGVVVDTTAPELTVFDPEVLGSPGPVRLVWDLKALVEERPDLDERLLIDAHTGEAVRRYPLSHDARSRRIYDANNTSAEPGTLRRTEGGAPSAVADVNDAYDFLGDAYDFYNTEHGRDGIDGAGMVISATVRHCTGDPLDVCPYDNAYWSGQNNRLYFGDGWEVDDVAAHEYTHGVTGHESALVYENHSGALDESLADVWGEFVDLGNNAGTDTAAVRWEIGEDLAGGALRDMSDPPAFGDPDRLNHASFVAPVANPTRYNDYGGVHTNSGVNNKLCYLLTDGDTFNGQSVGGLGIGKVADLYYEAATNLLTSSADYTDLYHALRQAAANLGWSAAERNNLYRACLAVEIADSHAVYVDGSHVGAESGSAIFPFNTVTEGYSAAFPGDFLYIAAGSYNETLTFEKAIDVDVSASSVGPVIIGE